MTSKFRLLTVHDSYLIIKNSKLLTINEKLHFILAFRKFLLYIILKAIL